MNRPDFSSYLAHFTKDSPANNTCALDNLKSILKNRVIKKHSIPWVKVDGVCFTECPWGSLINHSHNYSPYGIGFSKGIVFAAGGNPVFYINDKIFNLQKKDKGFDSKMYGYLTPFKPSYAPKSYGYTQPLDYSHEREWRILHDFEFEYDKIEFVVLKSYLDIREIDEEIVKAIGYEKFLFMDTYRKIEELWPVHIIDK